MNKMNEAMKPYHKLLKWALDEIANQNCVEGDKTPSHGCGYTEKPDEGYCEFHEKYWDARKLLDDANEST